jgi:hypothetical protein
MSQHEIFKLGNISKLKIFVELFLSRRLACIHKDISTLSGGVIGGEGQTVDWSSPNRAQLMNQAAQRPAEVVFKEKSQEEDRQSRPVQMSESELRRTADKIYHIIEDRIRRERRLLGL